jgi:tetratricopeptide (TPR) repeat protein
VPSRAYLYLNVAIAAIAAAGVVVGLTLDTRSSPQQPKAHAGKPPQPTNLPGPAGPAIEAAFKSWPHGSIDAMQRLGLQYAAHATPKERQTSALVEYFRGLALLWAGYPADAETALELAKKRGHDTLIQGRADDLLHPDFFQPPSGPPYPQFTPTRPNKLLEQGSQLQAQGHQESAERLYARAARQAPNDDEAQVAKAVGLFDEDRPEVSFGALGPLTARFPQSQIVRFYLGYLLAWTNQGDKAVKQFELAVKLGPATAVGKAAQNFVTEIEGGPAGTSK